MVLFPPLFNVSLSAEYLRVNSKWISSVFVSYFSSLDPF